MPIAKRKTYAAIDLGSNSFHLLVSTLISGQLHPIDSVKHMVHLAAGLDAQKNIRPDAMHNAFESLRTFAQRIENIEPERIKVVGTNTLRKAKNAAAFIEQAEQILQHEIEIISGREEARLLYLGVAHSSPDSPGKRLVIDIGGGSTELIIGEGFKPATRESLFMGCVGMSLAAFADGVISDRNWQRAVLKAQREISPIRKLYLEQSWEHVIGASGTIKATANILIENGWSVSDITRKGLNKLIRRCLSLGHVDRLVELKGLDEERRAVYIGGLAIIKALFESLKIDQMAVSSGALREGLIYQMAGKLEARDVRSRAINKLSKLFSVDTRQVEHVRSMARTLIRLLPADRALGDKQRDILSRAIDLHEIGLSIAHHQYHKHAAYIIQNADIPGFSRQEQHLIAVLVRLQRQKISTTALSQLNKKQLEFIVPLVVILRLAVIFCRDRKLHNVQVSALHWEGQHVTLVFSGQWLKRHPLIKADLDSEIGKLESLGVDLRLNQSGP